MGVEKASQQGNLNLDYNSMKIKKNWKMKLMGIGGKIDKANNEMKTACDESKTGATDTKDGVKDANIGADSADQSEYEMIDGENQADTTQTEADAGQVQATEGQTVVDESTNIQATQLATNEKIAAMTEGLSGTQEELMTQLQEKMDLISEAGEQLTANGEEVMSLQSELEGLMADSSEGGEYSTGMAAAGGQNSAYSLSVPTGGNSAQGSNKARKGGLISSGTQQAQQAQGAQQGQQTQGAQNSDATKTARIQEIYARLVEINEQNCTIKDTITSASEEAMVLQTEVTEVMETQTTEVTEDQQTADEGNAAAMEKLAKFQEITTVGTAVNLAGTAVKGVGRGMASTGLVVEKGGKSVSTMGKFLKGMFGGIKLTGTAVAAIFPVFTGAPGGTVANIGQSGEVTSKGIDKTGKGISVIGGNVNKTGLTVANVGQGIKVTGQGIQAVGSAGTMVVGIEQGNWTAIIGGAVGFLGSAATFVGNTAQFAQALGAAKDGFLGACANLETTIGSLLGNAGSLSQVASKGSSMGNQALQNGTGGFGDMITNAATTFVPEAAGLTSTGTTGTTTSTGTGSTTTTGTQSTESTESSEPTVQVATAISTPAMRSKAKTAGLTDEQIKGKSDSEIQQLIDEKNAANKPKADGTK